MSASRSAFFILCASPNLRLGFKTAGLVLMLALGGSAAAFGAKPPRCSDVPISVTFVGTTAAPAAISNDVSNIAYQNGVDGVAAVIHYNMDCGGTRDATLNLGNSKRSLMMQFPNPIPGSIVVAGPPSFAGGSGFATQNFINIRNIVGYNTQGLTPGVAATYYTKITSSNIVGPDGNSYDLVLFPDNSTCPAICASTNDGTGLYHNSPVQAAWSKVTYTPRDTSQPWSLSNADSWVVDGEMTSNEPPATSNTYERATLFFVSRRGATTHYGQYSMPFKILITALAPLQ